MSTTRKRLAHELLPLTVVVGLTLVGRASLADHYEVPSGSMEPTLQIDDHVVVNKLAYGVRVPFTTHYLVPLSEPARGDVVVLASPEDGVTLIKRVTAVGGDLVEVRDGELLVNGTPCPLAGSGQGLEEELGGEWHAVQLGGPSLGPVRVPPDHLLVMGDNRGNSRDGRTFGFVAREQVLGRAAGVFYRHGFTWHPL